MTFVKRLLIAAPIATAVIVSASYVGWSSEPQTAVSLPRQREVGVEVVQGPATDRAQLERLVTAFEAKASVAPNATVLSFLGQLYLQRGLENGDAASYEQARVALVRSSKLFANDPETRLSLASVLGTTHDFEGSLEITTRLLDENPKLPGAVALAGDALLELGRYDDARAMYTRLLALSPQAPAAVARSARLAYIEGDVDRARAAQSQAHDLAVDSALSGSALAWYSVAEANLAWELGDYQATKLLAARAMREAPEYYLSRLVTARALEANGDRVNAIQQYERLVERLPQPEFVAALGSLYEASGRSADARAQYETVNAIGAIGTAQGQLFNRQISLFNADHDVDAAKALRFAEAELKVRKDVFGWDAYAWALHANGRDNDAVDAIRRALALKTPNARMLYHAGVIASAVGDTEMAKLHLRGALDLNPAFDPLQSQAARKLLGSL